MGRLREVVFGAQDGLLSTVALVTGVAVAVENQTTVLVAGLAAALPGMLSMATGAFLGSRAEQDVQRAEIAREAQELEDNPAEELAELVVLYQREGKTYQEARHLADEIAQDKELWLRTLVEKELGISPDETSSPVKDALTMGIAFILAAIIPILPHFFLEGGPAIHLHRSGTHGLIHSGRGQGPAGAEIATPAGIGDPGHRGGLRGNRLRTWRLDSQVDRLGIGHLGGGG